MRHERRADEVSYQGHQRKLKTLGWWCAQCGESILEGDALRATERAFLELKAEVDGVLGPSEVAAVRQKIGLSQRKAGKLLGGGPRAFQKYEAGTQAVSVPMNHLLILLANDPKRLRELPSVAKTVKRPGDAPRAAKGAKGSRKAG
jgi:HTH-type transcriptional regulator/antitoxin MqsA